MKRNDLLQNEILNIKSFEMKLNFYMNIISKDTELQGTVSSFSIFNRYDLDWVKR